MAITPKHINDVCQAGTTCKYLCWESVDGKSVALCMKLAQGYYKQVRRDMLQYDIDLEERSDNCKGYLMLKHVAQGYDVDKK